MPRARNSARGIVTSWYNALYRDFDKNHFTVVRLVVDVVVVVVLVGDVEVAESAGKEVAGRSVW